jgi:hypothetical protein
MHNDNYTKDVIEMSNRIICFIKNKKVKNQKICDNVIQYNNQSEQEEYVQYKKFLSSKNCDFVYNLRGCDNI